MRVAAVTPMARRRRGVVWLLRRVCHWGVLVTVSLIVGIAYATVMLRFYPTPFGEVGLARKVVFVVSVSLLVWSYFTAVFTEPARVHYRPAAEEVRDMHFGPASLTLLGNTHPLVQAKDVLQECSVCDSFKLPRAHHCSQCGCCVNKMDHHCPWINCCVHATNHKAFCLFLFYVVVSCVQSAAMLTCVPVALIYSWPREYSRGWILGGFWCFCASLALVLAMCILGRAQYLVVRDNCTQIEDYIRYKAEERRLRWTRKVALQQDADTSGDAARPIPDLVFAYDLGWRRNLRMVFGPLSLRFFLPLYQSRTAEREAGRLQRRRAEDAAGGSSPRKQTIEELVDNDTYWEVAPGTGQFTLPIEQLSQKAEKARSMKAVEATQRYRGTTCATVCCAPREWTRYGCRAGCWNAPSCFEPRLSLTPGTSYHVSRSTQHGWMYGVPQEQPSEDGSDSNEKSSKKRPSGWFPRRHVRQIAAKVCHVPLPPPPLPSTPTTKQLCTLQPYGIADLRECEGRWLLPTGETVYLDPQRVRLEGGSGLELSFHYGVIRDKGPRKRVVLLGLPARAIETRRITWENGHVWERIGACAGEAGAASAESLEETGVPQ